MVQAERWVLGQCDRLRAWWKAVQPRLFWSVFALLVLTLVVRSLSGDHQPRWAFRDSLLILAALVTMILPPYGQRASSVGHA
jgi:hypothetical protein